MTGYTWASMHRTASENLVAAAREADDARALDLLALAIRAGQRGCELAANHREKVLTQGLVNTAMMMAVMTEEMG